MLQFILLLFGLAFPNTQPNTVNADTQTTTISTQDAQTNDANPGDTGGDTVQIPPKK